MIFRELLESLGRRCAHMKDIPPFCRAIATARSATARARGVLTRRNFGRSSMREWRIINVDKSRRKTFLAVLRFFAAAAVILLARLRFPLHPCRNAANPYFLHSTVRNESTRLTLMFTRE